MRALPRLLGAACLGSALAAAPLSAAEWAYSGSLAGASGTYTLSESTTSLVLVNGLSWTQGRLRLALSLPVVYQDTPYLTYVGGTPTPTGRRLGAPESAAAAIGLADPAVAGRSIAAGVSVAGSSGSGRGGPSGRGSGTVAVPDPSTQSFDEVGIGDPLVRVDLRLAGDARTGLGLFATAKAPLANETSGFGTGEWDFGGGVSWHAAVGSGRLFGEVGYWIYGDLPDLELDDPFAATVGYGRSFHDTDWSWMVSLWALSEGVDEIDGPAEASCALLHRLGRGRSLSLTLAAGLNESAADLRIVVGWVFQL